MTATMIKYAAVKPDERVRYIQNGEIHHRDRGQERQEREGQTALRTGESGGKCWRWPQGVKYVALDIEWDFKMVGVTLYTGGQPMNSSDSSQSLFEAFERMGWVYMKLVDNCLNVIQCVRCSETPESSRWTSYSRCTPS